MVLLTKLTQNTSLRLITYPHLVVIVVLVILIIEIVVFVFDIVGPGGTVPEPGTMALLGAGLVAFALRRRMRG